MSRPLSFATLLAVGLLALAPVLGGAAPAEAYDFPRVRGLEPNVAFWRKVYAVWSQDEIAFHDRDDFRILYRVVKVPPKSKKAARRAAVVAAENELVAALKSLDKKQPKSAAGLEGVELEVYENLKDIKAADKFRRTSSLRAQNGLRERFVAGYRSAGAYEPQVRERLRLAGLPEDIIALAYVESLMDIRARSHAGAVGMWQFMKPTAQEYMQVNHVLDERMDPIIAADAAAKYLNTALKNVGPWPVAITSYNYGRSGMAKAIKAVGSDDLADILERYEHKRFGLAARNYYASFLAVHDVLKNPGRYLPGVKQRAPWRFDVVRLPFGVLSTQLVATGAISQHDLVFLNPALTERARTGQEVLPAGLPLRVPRGAGERVAGSIMGFSPRERQVALAHVRKWHAANGKHSLTRIARLYGVNVDEVADMNGLDPQAKPKRGTKVAIPSTPVRFSLFPEAKGVPVPTAPKLRVAAPLVASRPPPPDEDVKAERKGPAVKPPPRNRQRWRQGRGADAAPEESAGPQVKLLSLVSVPDPAGGPELPGIDVMVGDPSPLAGVDVLTGDSDGVERSLALPDEAPLPESEPVVVPNS